MYILYHLSMLLNNLSSRQEPPEAVGKYLFSPFPACFRGGATRSFPYLQLLSCPSQNRTSSFPTSGSSVRPSVCLRPTTWVQVFADSRFRPLHPGQSLAKACPGVRPALALAVKPFEQNPFFTLAVVLGYCHCG